MCGAAFESGSGADGVASLIFLRFHVKTLTFIWLITPLSCVAQIFSNASRPGFTQSYYTSGYAEILLWFFFLLSDSRRFVPKVSGGTCLSHHQQSLGCSSWVFVEPLSGESWVDIEIVSCRGKVTTWPLSVSGENALPIAKQSEVRPQAC